MLTSVADVIKEVGGPSRAAELAGVGIKAVSNWKARGVIPAENFMIFETALAERMLRIDPTVFGIKRAEART